MKKQHLPNSQINSPTHILGLPMSWVYKLRAPWYNTQDQTYICIGTKSRDDDDERT